MQLSLKKSLKQQAQAAALASHMPARCESAPQPSVVSEAAGAQLEQLTVPAGCAKATLALHSVHLVPWQCWEWTGSHACFAETKHASPLSCRGVNDCALARVV